MVLAAFDYNKTSPISFTDHKMSTLRYVELLDSVLIDFAENFCSENWTFQQDNAAIHNTAVTKTFFSQINMCVMKWPATSSDLNLKENLWGILSGLIYFGGRQFNSQSDLRRCIESKWRKIPISTLPFLIESSRDV